MMTKGFISENVVNPSRSWAGGSRCGAGVWLAGLVWLAGAGGSGAGAVGQPPPLEAWISRTLTLRAQLTGFRAAPGTGLQSAGGGPSSMPTAQQACQVSVAVIFQVPGWRKVTPQSAVPLAPVRATAPGLLTISFEPR